MNASCNSVLSSSELRNLIRVHTCSYLKVLTQRGGNVCCYLTGVFTGFAQFFLYITSVSHVHLASFTCTVRFCDLFILTFTVLVCLMAVEYSIILLCYILLPIALLMVTCFQIFTFPNVAAVNIFLLVCLYFCVNLYILESKLGTFYI